MAQLAEPMDVDNEFDNKENTFHHSNVLPCTEKGYEELDVSELNMRLRYSVTPASSPMSKSCTAYVDNNLMDSNSNEANLTRSLNAMMSKNDSVTKALKSLPLQALPAEQFVDGNGHLSIAFQLDSTLIEKVTDIDENLSLPSSSSSELQTPARTPTKDMKNEIENGSPIMRGLKSVLNMFRSSQSPIPPTDSEVNQQLLGLAGVSVNPHPEAVASTPIAAHKMKDGSSRKSSPLKDSIIFNDDLEKELNWKDETTIIFSDEKIPVHKLFLHSPIKPQENLEKELQLFNLQKESQITNFNENMNATVEYMDVSYNESMKDGALTDVKDKNDTVAIESDSEFVDCETTFNKTETDLESQLTEKDNNALPTIDGQKPSLPEVASIINENTLKIETYKTNVTFTDEDINDVSVPSDYSNYSKETTEILSDLENIEATLSLNINTSDVNKTQEQKHEEIVLNEIITKEKIAEDRLQTDNILQNITKDVTDQDINNITQTKNPKDDNIHIKIVPEVQPDINEDNITQDTPQTTPGEDISNVLDVASADIKEAAEQKAETSIVKGNIGDVKIAYEYSTVKVPTVTFEDLKRPNATINIHTDTLTIQHDKPLEIPLSDDELLKESETIASVSPGVIQDRVIDTVFPEIEKPADVPLPDDDDDGKDSLVITDIPADTLSGLRSIIQDTSSIQTQIYSDEGLNNFVEGKMSYDIIPETVNDTQDPPVQSTEKNIEPIENLPIVNVGTEDVVSNETEKSEASEITPIVSQLGITETNKNIKPISIENVPIVTVGTEDVVSVETEKSEASDIIPFVSQLEITETNKEIQEKSPEHNNATYTDLPEIVSTCKTLTEFDQTYECIETQKNNISLSTQDITVTKDKTENIPNHENVEPMDITMNETLNQTHDLPDLVNQTISTTDEKLENKIETISETAVVPQEVAISECSGNMTDNESVQLKVTTPQNKESMNLESVEINANDVTGNTTYLHSEIKQTDNVVKNNEKVVDIQPLEIKTDQVVDAPVESVDEVFILSRNNSPYVSLMAGLDKDSEKVEQHLEDEETLNTTNIPSSPPIRSRGYNFNFDEIDDPFAIKTKMRMSAPLDSSPMPIELSEEKKVEIPKKMAINRRKSQAVERKKPADLKKKLNASFNIELTSKMSTDKGEVKPEHIRNDLSIAGTINKSSEITQKEEPQKLNPILTNLDEIVTGENTVQDIEKQLDNNEENKTSIESITSVSNDPKSLSSLDQSTYYSAGTSSTESVKTKNVFNLPEIDDINFNPFATKSKMRLSPQGDMDIENKFATNTKIVNSPDASMVVTSQYHLNSTETVPEAKKLLSDKWDSADKIEIEPMEKDTSAKSSIDNESLTTPEVNTDDEDTEEGPFFESEDLIDKMSDFDDGNIDMMQFNELPPQGADDGGELFIDADAYEFLLNQNQSNVVADSGKESLFLKFDPLFANRISSDGVLAALNKEQRKQSTPTKPARPSLINEASPIAEPSTMNTTSESDSSEGSNEDMNLTVVKPMMVVTPAVNPAVTPRTKSTTPTRSNRRSITFTSPAIAVIDRLLSMSSNNSFVGEDTPINQPNREQNEADLALTQLREILAEKEISVYNLRSESKELKDRLSCMESQVKILEADGQDRLKKINELNERLVEKTKINKSMAAVVEEYERTIASLIAETEQDRKRNAEERIRLIKERDEQTAHLASMEVSFCDLHNKYEKSKQVILSCKANEEIYKNSIKDFEENVHKMKSNYELLKQHATSKLNQANQELDKINRNHEAEVVKFNALIKRKELHITSLEETLMQKTKANEELTAICDELINKVG